MIRTAGRHVYYYNFLNRKKKRCVCFEIQMTQVEHLLSRTIVFRIKYSVWALYTVTGTIRNTSYACKTCDRRIVGWSLQQSFWMVIEKSNRKRENNSRGALHRNSHRQTHEQNKCIDQCACIMYFTWRDRYEFLLT